MCSVIGALLVVRAGWFGWHYAPTPPGRAQFLHEPPHFSFAMLLLLFKPLADDFAPGFARHTPLAPSPNWIEGRCGRQLKPPTPLPPPPQNDPPNAAQQSDDHQC